jgi:thioester reductase-like protein
MQNILECLEHWTKEDPQKSLFTFLDAAGREERRFTYRSFADHTRRLAAHLARQAGLAHGDRALLVYPAGLEMIAAFFACLRLGAIPVPVHAPPAGSAEGGFQKLEFVARDCQAKVALSTGEYWSSLAEGHAGGNGRQSVARPLAATRQVATDVCLDEADDHVDQPHPIMFLQYTSGSTGDPRGVIVSQENVLHNARQTVCHCPVGVSWLPQYHDMGLIGFHLFVVVLGGSNYGFSPFDFLRRPALWLQAISRYRATFTAAPNFAFEYCLREGRMNDDELRDCDLSSLRVMLNAAEPVRPDTLRRFNERFAPFGLLPQAHVAGYGLAENTVAVSMHGRQALTVNKRLLQQRRLHIEKTPSLNNNQVALASCGQPLPGIRAQIVDPSTRAPLGDDRIGEIWVAGESKCQGYWGRTRATRQTFQARIADEDADASTWLRTGDLGFMHEDELYVCGRLKDLIIIRGVNYYPQDIEAIIETSFPDVARGGSGRTAAFSVEADGEERLVVVLETRNRRSPPEPSAITAAIRARYFIEPHTILFVPPRTIAKTTSGKIARAQTRERWLRGELPVLAAHVGISQPTEAPSGLHGLLERIRQLYNLTGREEQTVAEIGMDSLTMVDLVLEIQKHFEEQGADELVDAVDAGFLQSQTIAGLCALVDGVAGEVNGRLPDMRQQFELLQDQHAAHEAARMQADVELVPATAVATTGWDLPLRTVAPERVLLTGPTGFFGPFLLAALLDKTSAAIDVLVRATDAAHGHERLAAAMRRANLFTPEFEARFRERVTAVAGDLSRENLGLSARAWGELAERTGAILHNGATVNYVHSYEALRSHNVLGTRELLRLAMTGAAKPFHLVSSTFIFGWSPKAVLWETDGNNQMQRLDFGYSQTKWVAEQLVRRAAGRGLPTRIYRPSLISPSTTLAGSRDDIAIRLLAFMIKYGVAVQAHNQISFLPADVAADNIVSIFRDAAPDGGALHVTADEYYSFMDVTRLISELYGYSFRYRAIPEFVADMNRLCTKDDLLYPLRVFLNRSHRKIEAMENKRYDNREYRLARGRGGDGREEPCLSDTVSHIVEYMLHEGLIPARPDGPSADADLPPRRFVSASDAARP